MRAAQVTSLDGPDAVGLVDLPDPDPSEFADPGSDVLIDVEAAGVAFPDVLMTRGLYQLRPELPFVPGVEVAGTVLAAPPEARVAAGDRVAAHIPHGGLAERATASPLMAFPLPDELSFAEGAGLVVNYHTAVFALRDRAGMRRGETVIVHGAAGGLGSAALQVIAGLGGRSLAVVSTEEKAEFARAAGADEVAVGEEWARVAEEALGGRNADIIFDPVGGDRVVPSLRLLRVDGRLLVVGFTSGEIPEVKVNRLLLSNTSVVGAGYGAYVARNPATADSVGAAVNELVAAGHVRPPISRRFALDEAVEAMRLIEDRAVLGKVVVELP